MLAQAATAPRPGIPEQSSRARTEAFARRTFFEHGSEQLDRLCRAVGLAHRASEIVGLFGRLIEPWGHRPVGRTAAWASHIGDDHSPYEFSVALGGEPELRILVEALGDPPGLRGNRPAALALNELLHATIDADLSRFETIRDLFLPDEVQGSFVAWHAVSFWPERPPEAKLYLNPQARGRHHAPALLEEALGRLGFAGAWPYVTSTAAARGPELDEAKYISLDLSAHRGARVKIYLRHHAPTLESLELAASAARSYQPGEVSRFVQELAGGALPPAGRPLATCLSFLAEEGNRPSVATIHFPVGAYAPNDAVVARRVTSALEQLGLPKREYLAPLEATASQPLDAATGLQSYASFKRGPGGPKVTVYFPPELYQPGKQPEAWSPTPPRTAAEIVERFERQPITDHPFFQRLRREPVSLPRLYHLMRNAQIGIVKDFARRLAHAADRAPDDRIRCILARQLNDELGSGKYERAHSVLFGKLVEGLDPYRPADFDELRLAPGRTLRENLERVYFAEHPLAPVGATIVIEIMGRQVDQFTGDEFRRQKQVAPDTLEWLSLHEELEEDHAAESLNLANLTSPADLPAVWRGAQGVALAAWRFFDDVYGVCFP
jgi:DMATS type aromatic prenyltransferase